MPKIPNETMPTTPNTNPGEGEEEVGREETFVVRFCCNTHKQHHLSKNAEYGCSSFASCRSNKRRVFLGRDTGSQTVNNLAAADEHAKEHAKGELEEVQPH